MDVWTYSILVGFFSEFLTTLQNSYPATFDSGGAGKTNSALERLGYYALFASVAKTLVFTQQIAWWQFKKPKNVLDQTLNTRVDEIFSFIEFEKASNKS